MGFALFTKSGIFDPIAYGLTVGDTLYVVCVGGGGGGGVYHSTNTGANGGTGGASSFGSYVTSLGGAGGNGRSNSTRLSNQGTFLGGAPDTNNLQGGGGAGGWLPGYTQYGGDARPLNVWSSDFDSMGHIEIPPFAGYCGYVQFPTFFHTNSNNATQYSPGGIRIHTTGPQRPMGWLTTQTTYNGTNVTSTPINGTHLTNAFNGNGVRLNGVASQGPVCGGNSPVSFYYQSAYDFRQNIQNAGGIGYGAGGAGGTYMATYYNNKYCNSYGGFGGNSGEIKTVQVSLASADSIAVSVGGGGSGGAGHYYHQTAYFKHGNNGSAGAGGASTATVSNAGGYGDSPSGETPLLTAANISSTKAGELNAGGGGASGCVAIWW